MEEEQAMRIERMEKVWHELYEWLLRTQEKIREQLAKMMEMMIAMFKG